MMVGDRKGPPGSIWRLPGYGGFFLAATLGRVADEMLAIAVVLLVLDRTSSPALAGATVAAASLPSVLTGPVLGAWLDRTTHRRAALAANQVLLASALVGMLLAAGRAPAWVIPALAVEAGIAMLSLVAIARMRPIHGAGPDPVTATSAAPGGAGPGEPAGTSRPSGAGADGTTLGSALRAGLAHLARTPVLRGVTVTTSLAMGAQGLLPIALPLLSERLGAGRGGAGYLYAAQELGAITGALLAVRVAASWPAERVVIGGTVLGAAGTAGLALVPTFPLAVAVVAVTGLAAGPAFAALFAVRQQWSPPSLRGQIFTTGASLKIGAYAIGAALAGPAVTGTGPRGAIVATAAAELAAVLTGLAASRSRGAARRPGTTDSPGELRGGEAGPGPRPARRPGAT